MEDSDPSSYPLTNSSMNWCTDIDPKSSSKVFCVVALNYTIGDSNVRAYDVAILFFTLLFLVYLLVTLPMILKKLRKSFPLFSILYCLVLLIPVVSCVHSVLSMIVGHGKLAPEIAHFLLRGTILTTEISVVVFGLTFKYYHRERHKLALTMFAIVTVAVIYTLIEALLDVLKVNPDIVCKDQNLFLHGGMIFTFVASVLFALAYLSIFGIYIFGFYKKWNLPSKASFYRYALFLSAVNTVQAVGSMLWYYGSTVEQVGHIGICLVTITSDIYLITFAPMVYWIFLRKYFTLKLSSGGAGGQAAPVHVNISNQDSIVGAPRWLRWALRPTGPVRISTSNKEESSRMISENVDDDDSDIASSYGSINS